MFATVNITNDVDHNVEKGMRITLEKKRCNSSAVLAYIVGLEKIAENLTHYAKTNSQTIAQQHK